MKKAFLITLLSLFAFNAAAVEYSSTISINVTDKDATSAKEKAWAHSNRVALNNVMKKISNNVSLDYLTDEQILNLVKQTEVLSEKNSSTTYIGKLKIVFNKEVLDNFLKEKNIQKINVQTSKVLAIPLYKPSYVEASLLWEDNNLLKKAFEKTSYRGIVKVETIKNNTNNNQTATVDELLSLNKQTLSKLANTNLVEDIFVINAKNNGVYGLNVEVSHFNKNNIISQEHFTVDGNTESNATFNSAAKVISEYINNKIKENSFNNQNTEKTINAVYNFNSLHQYLWVKKDLSKATYIKNITPVAMQKDRIELQITYTGSYEKLLYSIKNKGLTLKEVSGQYILERI